MYGFIVAACLREQVHKESLSCCLNSIKQFHENISIVVVVDYTSEQKKEKKEKENEKEKIQNTKIVKPDQASIQAGV